MRSAIVFAEGPIPRGCEAERRHREAEVLRRGGGPEEAGHCRCRATSGLPACSATCSPWCDGHGAALRDQRVLRRTPYGCEISPASPPFRMQPSPRL
eukprot:1184718-Pyramimonas_sp.AAC.1